MNNLVKFIILVCFVCLLNACDETKETGKKPAPIETYTVTPIHGGAKISFSIPKDPDILYVLAEYERNGEPFTELSSTHKNSVIIEGFNTLEPVSATLYTVSRDFEVKSDPLRIEFVPLESPINLTYHSTTIVPAFGGILVSWENLSKTELGVRLMVDSAGTMIEKELYFSSIEFEKHPFRGYESIETTFVLRYEDKWGNVSEPIRFTGTPLFETEIEKPWTDMRAMIPYDNISEEGSTYAFSKIWDNAIGNSNSYLNVSGTAGSSMTFDLGKVVKLSRMSFWMTHYHPDYTMIYGTCNIEEFEMWGCRALDQSKLPPADRSYWLHPFSAEQNGLELPAHTFMDDWVYLGRYEIARIQNLNDYQAAVIAGFQFDIPIECDPVRIIRFFPIATANGGSPPARNNWWIAEMSFWGDNTIPQD